MLPEVEVENAEGLVGTGHDVGVAIAGAGRSKRVEVLTAGTDGDLRNAVFRVVVAGGSIGLNRA